MTTDPATTDPATTETVVGNHLRAFLEQRGIDAIVEDYADGATFFSEAGVHRGRDEIGRFFADFLDALPPQGIERFGLRSLHVDGEVAYITWDVGGDIPLGTDTFVVCDGKIVYQSYAMYAVPDR